MSDWQDEWDEFWDNGEPPRELPDLTWVVWTWFGLVILLVLSYAIGA
jgi:hypothetical protein